MRNPNASCEICNKPVYRKSSERGNHVCCRIHRSELYVRHPEIVKNLDKGRGWNKGMSRKKGDVLSYGRPRSEETKGKISQRLIGRVVSEEHRKAISKARIELFNRIGRVGKRERGYLSARWRRAVYERDNHACQKCGSKEEIIAHHILSWKDYPILKYSLDNGISLCSVCHKKLHKHKTRNNPL